VHCDVDNNTGVGEFVVGVTPLLADDESPSAHTDTAIHSSNDETTASPTTKLLVDVMLLLVIVIFSLISGISGGWCRAIIVRRVGVGRWESVGYCDIISRRALISRN